SQPAPWHRRQGIAGAPSARYPRGNRPIPLRSVTGRHKVWTIRRERGRPVMGRKRRRLAERRKAVGLSQERLAEAVGVDPSTVARWERGETDPQPVHRPRLADVLGVSVEEIGDLLTGASTAASQTDDRLRYVLQQPGRVDLVTAVQLRKRVDDLDLRYITTPPTML